MTRDAFLSDLRSRLGAATNCRPGSGSRADGGARFRASRQFRGTNIPLERTLQVTNCLRVPSCIFEVKLIAAAGELVDLFETRMQDFEITSGSGDSGNKLSKHDPSRGERIVRQVGLG